MNKVLLLTGPTGVGKTQFIYELSKKLLIEVINADVGQLYAPLTIGTAKPLPEEMIVPHHLFSILDKPCNFTVTEFRIKVQCLLDEIWHRERLPVIVGGSLFYIKSLFFKPCLSESTKNLREQFERSIEHRSTGELWDELASLDRDRAEEIQKNDRYRIQRALEIWYTRGIKPSLCKPTFECIADAIYLYALIRDKDDLHIRIRERIKAMLGGGWYQEVKHLQSEWYSFLYEKNLLGYPHVIEIMNGTLSESEAQETIAAETRAYAKRQMTFWRHLVRQLRAIEAPCIKELGELNLTLSPTTLYIDELVSHFLEFKVK